VSCEIREVRSGRVPEIECLELARRLEGGEPVQVLDVRAPERLTAGMVEPVQPGQFRNVRGSELLTMDDPEGELGLDRNHPVAVVCGHGNDSRIVAFLLGRHGFEAWSLRGGVTAWMRMVVPRLLPPPPGFDGLIQFDRVGKGALGYLLSSGTQALAIDPARDVEPYREAARQAGTRIIGVIDSHVHADYISGGPALAADAGAPYYLHAADNVWPYEGVPGRLDHEPLREGDRIEVGEGEVRIQHTPGHTEGSVTVLAGDSREGAAAFTGDFLFVASVGRPDLAGRTEAWSGDLWRSLCRAREEWEGHVRILPAHYATDDERNADRSVDRPLGEVRRANEPLGIGTEREFRSWIEAHLSAAPQAYPRIKAINVGLAAVTDEEADWLEAGKNECALS